ncbi:MAG: S-adenosylmethionine:tRNA ribosyltransferase-isomerase [Bacteroidales bacterium]|nr:S-adenosylmethionine:tRNA ribosyltransferase-isomerase [Bacteroidales bacterium]
MNNSITNSLKDIKVPDLKEFSFSLPQERIAIYPLPERDMSKLLIYNNGIISENIFKNIFEYLPENSCIVFNNSKVIKARFFFEKESGGKIEILCLEPLTPVDLYKSLRSKKTVEWKCIIGNLKKWKNGITIRRNFLSDNKTFNLYAERVGKEDGEAWRIRFSWDPDDLTFGQVIELAGHVPLPPYIKRDDEPEDYFRYQTVYSKIEGSVAAPTAGLHFTPKLLEQVKNKSIEHIDITLHVSAGTFLPVKEKNIIEHEMHREFFSVDASSIERLLRIINNHSPVISVGTTSMRALESIYWAGVKLSRNYNKHANHNSNKNIYVSQWEPYIADSHLKVSESLEVLLDWMTKKGISTLRASTRLIIVPAYRFMIPDILITNFHMPESTLLLLVAAWIGPDWKKVYDYALSRDFRFLSYGDSSLLFRNNSDITMNNITNF